MSALDSNSPHTDSQVSLLTCSCTTDEFNKLTQSQERPFGVTIIAVLAIIDGVLLLFGGLSFLAFGTLFATVPIENIVINQQQQLQEVQNAAELQAY